ncbi:hypothetical protein PENTCL1PPCAC_3019 [Pristionchus entomophagus]|uniref:Choline/carnitine acyltransferase domain-containing protein n=1 Tax=Pristionchus entomophagus TaxID=358040 RepID=A0AAV5SL63_9BILA|nr:hypothetical protein PENTCL1PPCAC_3019 [Pristionchus entomophagus]
MSDKSSVSNSDDNLLLLDGAEKEVAAKPIEIPVRFRNAIFPFTFEALSYLSILLLVADALGLSPLGGATTVVETLLRPAFGNVSAPARVCALATVLLPTLAVIVLATRFFIYCCLHYTGYLYEEIGKKPSLPTKAFMVLIGALNKIPHAAFAMQGLIPTMRLPAEKETVQKYLRTVKPILSEEDYKEMCELAEDFLNNLGPELQKKLWMKWLFSKNYISDWWKEVVYMRHRDSLIRSNVGCSDICYRPTTSVQAARAAHVTLLRIRYTQEFIEEQAMAPISLGGIPMCSQQYVDYHRSLRAPALKSDVMIRLPPTKHIAVYCKGGWYKVPVYDGSRLINSAELERSLQSIIDRPSPNSPGELYLSALTCGQRDVWARMRAEKFAEGINRISLDAIESGMDIIFLDDEDRFFDEKDPSLLEREYKRALTGDGWALWMDKPSVYFFSKNGRFTSNAEHSVVDAMIHVHIREYTKYHEAFSPSYGPDGHCVGAVRYVPTPEKLKWSIDQETRDAINESYAFAKAIADDFDNAFILHTDYGKDFIKKAKVSPDAYIQMALQTAYYRDQGRFDLTYEPAVARLWREGRTETIRSCTQESCAFVRGLQDKNESAKSRWELLKTACGRHQEMTRDAMSGRGSDRHLFGLVVLSRYLEKSSPFLDKVFSMNYELSTSQVPQHQTKEFSGKMNKERDLFWPAGGFACPDGSRYGVCYSIGTTGDLFSCQITSWKSIQNTSATRFRDTLMQVFREMREMVEEAIKQQ